MYKASHELRPFSDLLCILFQVLIIPDSSTRALWLQQTHLVVKQGVGKKSLLIYLMKYLSHTLQGSLTCNKILWHGANSFTSPPKEVKLWISITLKNPLSSARFECMNLGSNGKHQYNELGNI
jgi:hypothetical protein